MEDVIAGEREMVVQTAGQETSSERFLLPDVAFVQAASNLAYET
jgi:hypothetical protein